MSKKKPKGLYFGFILSTLAMFALIFIGLNALQQNIHFEYGSKTDQIINDLYSKLEKNYSVTVDTNRNNRVLTDSINAARAEHRAIIEQALAKQLANKLTSNVNALSKTQGYNFMILFVCMAAFFLIAIYCIIIASVSIRKEIRKLISTLALQNTVSTSEDIYHRRFQRPETSSTPDYNDNRHYSTDTDMETKQDEQPSFATEEFLADSLLEEDMMIETDVMKHQPISIDYDKELTNIGNEKDLFLKRGMLEKLYHETENDDLLINKKAIQYQILFEQALLEKQNGDMGQTVKLYDRLIALAPDHSEIYNLRGQVYADTLNYEAAIQDYSAAIQNDPSFEEVYFNRGIAFLTTEKYQEAIHDFAIYLNTNKKNPVAYYYKATAHYKMSEFEQALNEYEQATLLDPNYEEAFYNKGIICFHINAYDEALKAFYRVIELNAENAHAHKLCGKIMLTKGQPQEAISHFSTAIGLQPDYTAAYKGRADSYLAIANYQAAIQDYNQVLTSDPNMADILQYRGLAFFYLKEYDKAIADFNIAIELDNNIDLLLKRAISYYKLGDSNTCLSDLNRVLETDPLNEEALKYKKIIEDSRFSEEPKAEIQPVKNSTETSADLQLAIENFNKGNFEQAISDFDKILNSVSDNSQVYYMRGLSFGYLKKYEEALSDLIKAIELDPDNIDIHYSIGNVYTNLKQNYNAIDAYTNAIQRNNSMPEIYFNRANIYYNEKKYGEAINDYTKAIEINPNYTKAYFNRGLTYKMNKQFNESIAEFNRVIQLEPNNTRLIEKAQKQIDTLKNLL